MKESFSDKQEISATYVNMFTWFRRNCPAFTLAEVLVTLGIIGVVAAMTLPSVIDNSRNKQLESALKKSYSTLSQALDMYYAEEGVKLTPKNCGNSQLKPILMKYLHTAKDCGLGTLDAATRACVPSQHWLTDEQKEKGYIKYRNLNNTNDIEMALFDRGQFVLNDSSLVLCEDGFGDNKFISVDVNGYNKRPNRLGIDLFMFQINDEGALIPMGVKGTYFYHPNDVYCSWTLTGDANGAGCTYKALYEKDYFKNLPR